VEQQQQQTIEQPVELLLTQVQVVDQWDDHNLLHGKIT
jgi:hypothetical protein